MLRIDKANLLLKINGILEKFFENLEAVDIRLYYYKIVCKKSAVNWPLLFLGKQKVSDSMSGELRKNLVNSLDKSNWSKPHAPD